MEITDKVYLSEELIPLSESLPFTLTPPTGTPHCIYFRVLSFIINTKVNVQMSFWQYPRCEYTLL
jgi:hypothetical protein